MPWAIFASALLLTSLNDSVIEGFMRKCPLFLQ
ncbi:hypothetical protein T09_8047 [Trichinella sp. T9]|nr:hypothetical protein T09_8047 [Trichinella sp. T9]